MHLACTVEMVSLQRHWDVAVIDEARASQHMPAVYVQDMGWLVHAHESSAIALRSFDPQSA
jgi:hypothetical protein